MKLSVNVKYMIIQGLFWMIFCVALGFVSLILLDAGVSNSAIGVVSAVFGVISAVLQPVFGRLCDKNPNVSWKKMMIILSIFGALSCMLMAIVTGKIMSSICIGCLILLANLLLPFVNSALFYYKSTGEYVNFGIARGIGSAMYAVLAMVIGSLTVIYGTKVVPILGIIVFILFVLATMIMPYSKELDNKTKVSEKDTSKKAAGFVKKYPSFIIMIAGCILLHTTHCIASTYLLQIIQNVGGNSENLGQCIAIQAIVEVPVMFCFTLLLKKFSASKLMIFAAIGYLIKATSFFLAGSVMAIYFVSLTQMISFAIYASASVYYTGEVVDEADRTTGQAYMASVISVGTVIGSILGGFVIDLLGVKSLLLFNIVIGAVGLLIVLIAVNTRNKEVIDNEI